jgi:3-oxosteroid 1-dehydrogenase
VEEIGMVRGDPAWGGEEWERVTDVVVVGTGAAGGAAAAAASRNGASVLMLEKAAFPGGTTARSGGGMWIPNNFSLRERGIADDRDQCVRYMAHSAFPAIYSPDHPTLGLPAARLGLIESFFDHAAEVIDELRADGVLELGPFDFPDYYSDLPEAVPWAHQLVPLLPATWKRGDPGGGELLAAQLRRASEKHGGEVLLDHRVVDVVRNVAGEVIGVEARAGKRTVLIGARRGVVFGSGGFLHNSRMALEFLRGPVLGGAASATSTGDFVDIGIRAGAQLGNMSHAWWSQVVVEQVLQNPVTSRDIFYAYGDSMLMVNRHGRRVLNEKSPYTDRGQAHFVWDTGRHDYPNKVLFMVFDEAVRLSDRRDVQDIRGSRMGRYPVPFPEESPSYMISGETWEDLATAVGDRLASLAPRIGVIELEPTFVETLVRTVEQYNDFATRGYDPDFRRGEARIDRAWALPGRGKSANDSMHPLSESGPYHCVLVGPGALDTKGGPFTDGEGRVLDPHEAPIPGLYGAGNCVASPTGQAYWGPGCTIGVGLVFGYVAGRHAAREADRSPEVAVAEGALR